MWFYFSMTIVSVFAIFFSHKSIIWFVCRIVSLWTSCKVLDGSAWAAILLWNLQSFPTVVATFGPKTAIFHHLNIIGTVPFGLPWRLFGTGLRRSLWFQGRLLGYEQIFCHAQKGWPERIYRIHDLDIFFDHTLSASLNDILAIFSVAAADTCWDWGREQGQLACSFPLHGSVGPIRWPGRQGKTKLQVGRRDTSYMQCPCHFWERLTCRGLQLRYINVEDL